LIINDLQPSASKVQVKWVFFRHLKSFLLLSSFRARHALNSALAELEWIVNCEGSTCAVDAFEQRAKLDK
jgi:hypothetical protein